MKNSCELTKYEEECRGKIKKLKRKSDAIKGLFEGCNSEDKVKSMSMEVALIMRQIRKVRYNLVSAKEYFNQP